MKLSVITKSWKQFARNNAFVILILPCNIYAQENFRESYLKETSDSIIGVYCGDTEFLNKIDMNEGKCIQKLRGFTGECNDYIGPFIPEVVGDESDKYNLLLINKLGRLYGLCLKALILDSKRK